jgi:hypothetical protein
MIENEIIVNMSVSNSLINTPDMFVIHSLSVSIKFSIVLYVISINITANG